MATEYIKREDARTLLFDRLIETANNNTGYQCDSGVVYQDAAERLRICWINEVPTADVVERKHGVWLTGLVKDSDGSVKRTFSFCSVCNLLVEKETNYCPNCGAKMGIE